MRYSEWPFLHAAWIVSESKQAKATYCGPPDSHHTPTQTLYVRYRRSGKAPASVKVDTPAWERETWPALISRGLK